MITTCVHVRVKREYVDAFIAASTENHEGAVKEPGNLRFDLLQNDTDPCRFMLYEAYESEKASAAHKQTPHYKKWRETVEPFMAEPRKGLRYNILCPKDKTEW